MLQPSHPAERTSASSSTWRQLLPLFLLGSLRGGSSFLSPFTPIARRASSFGKNYAEASDVESMTPAQEKTPSGSPPAGLAVEEESDSGIAKSPEGLTLEGVYRKLKLETQGLDDGIVGLESKDTDYGVEIVKSKLIREPSLGIQLEEVARGGDGRGLVLVSGVEPGGNAEASGQIFVGDTLCWVGVEPTRMTRVEALDWDLTVSALGSLADVREITVVCKRLVKRKTINVQFELPDGDKSYDIKTGSNLRGEMIRLDVPVYDPKTLRYDQPYATGNCAGEGICGTCFVEIQEGAELLTPADREEDMLISKGNLPLRWRLSCKTIVGRENVEGTIRVKAVPQTEWREQRGKK
ncbi:unnamed protein product [Ascophyllum nodosum]